MCNVPSYLKIKLMGSKMGSKWYFHQVRLIIYSKWIVNFDKAFLGQHYWKIGGNRYNKSDFFSIKANVQSPGQRRYRWSYQTVWLFVSLSFTHLLYSEYCKLSISRNISFSRMLEILFKMLKEKIWISIEINKS